MIGRTVMGRKEGRWVGTRARRQAERASDASEKESNAGWFSYLPHGISILPHHGLNRRPLPTLSSAQPFPRAAAAARTRATHLRQIHTPVHHPHRPRRALHGLAHLLVRPERLDPKRHRLELGPHRVELLDVATGADEVLGHDLAGVLHTVLTTNGKGEEEEGPDEQGRRKRERGGDKREDGRDGLGEGRGRV
jgi:hypothetical protein